MKKLIAWIRSRDAVTAIEYAMIVGGVALVIVAVIFLVGDHLDSIYNTMAVEMAVIFGNV